MKLSNNPIANYFRSSYQELAKVAWPNRQQALRHSLTVIAVCIAVIIVLGAVDFILSLGLQTLIDRF